MGRALITGADGFVAAHLVLELKRETDWDLVGLGLREEPSVDVGGLEYGRLDLTRYDDVLAFIERHAPDKVFHLAAQASVALSWQDPWSTYRVNIMGQLNLLESLRKLGREVSVHVACSSEEYGKVPPEGMPLEEGQDLCPCSHYAVSKMGQEAMALLYYRSFGWRVLITRAFNQAGPGQSPQFVISSFARQIALIEAGLKEPVMHVGNLQAERDFTDVRDTARAYRLLMEKGEPGVCYNVCSGRAYPISEILEMLLELSDVDIDVEKDPARQRPSDVPLLLGDNSRIRGDTGWEPGISLDRTLRDTLDYWREEVDAGGDTA